MLLFELFPAFVTLVSVLVGVGLYLANARAASGPAESPPAPRAPARDDTPRRPHTGLRPSMRG
jgi:hypothetical protein